MSEESGGAAVVTFRRRPAYVLVRSGFLGFAVAVILLVVFTGAGTEGQPGLLVMLCIALGVVVLVGVLVVVSAWRLTVTFDGSMLVIRGLRSNTIDLVTVDSVGWRSWAGDHAVVLAGPAAGKGRPRQVSIPFGTETLKGFVLVSPWSPDQGDELLRRVYAPLTGDCRFDARAGARFAAAGCLLETTS